MTGIANAHRPAANCGSTKIGLRDLDTWLGDKKWDVIHFNWGLHDLGYRFDNDSNRDAKGNYARPDNGGHQNVPPDQYGKNLRELVHRLKKTGAVLIFATTTPVPADLHSYVKSAEVPYNEIARTVMREEGVAINNLWSFTRHQLDKIQIPGNPHFTAKGSEVLAREIAHVIRTVLPQSSNPAPMPDGKPHKLELKGGKFLIDGRPIRIVAGEMHLPRVLPEFWEDRIQKAKAMGLTAVSIYVMWNQIEPEEGQFNFEGFNNVRRFAKLCQANGIWLIVRPGPFVCAEFEFGGLPYWLMNRELRGRSRCFQRDRPGTGHGGDAVLDQYRPGKAIQGFLEESQPQAAGRVHGLFEEAGRAVGRPANPTGRLDSHGAGRERVPANG